MERRGAIPIMVDVLISFWTPLLAVLQIAAAAAASAHAMLHKRDVRAAIGWIGLIWLVPFGGPILYGLFGINRIRRRASVLRALKSQTRNSAPGPMPTGPPSGRQGAGESAAPMRPSPALPPHSAHLLPVVRLLDRITDESLTSGNTVQPLPSGEAAYDAMLAAIDDAVQTIGLATYIFDGDAIGRRFVDALGRAVRRGVQVRVLVDGVGSQYSRPRITGMLRSAGVVVAEFLPSLIPLSLHYANLRNHRKILVVDGRIGFTGGMNIRGGHLQMIGPAAVADVHFRLEGPVVAHLTETFAADWAFAWGEDLAGEGWWPALGPVGTVLARGIAGGPDEAFERVRWALLAALSQAQRRIRIATPYFLPDRSLAASLQLAALRGVAVEVLLPEVSNLRLMQWAMQAKLYPFVARGCRLWLTPPPFDHAKLMTVDGGWCLIGSANWDPRSLRLNFEFVVECYDAEITAALDRLIDKRLARARLLEKREIVERPLAVRLRDSAAWLLSPYL